MEMTIKLEEQFMPFNIFRNKREKKMEKVQMKNRHTNTNSQHS